MATVVRAQGQPKDIRPFAPLHADHPVIGTMCAACGVRFATGDVTCLVALGPGSCPEAREKALRGGWYTAVAIPIHWMCATGGEGTN